MPAKKTATKKEPVFTSTRPPTFVGDPTDPKKQTQFGPIKPDMEGYKGSYHKISEPKDSPPYGLKVLDVDEAGEHFGRTHHARSTEFSWTGTEQEFKEQFDQK